MFVVDCKALCTKIDEMKQKRDKLHILTTFAYRNVRLVFYRSSFLAVIMRNDESCLAIRFDRR